MVLDALGSDWGSFLPEMIASAFGSLVGFALAIVGERIIDWLKERDDAEEIKKLLSEELITCKNVLQNLDVNSLDVQPLKIPSWEGLSHSNQLSLLDVNTRTNLFNVYNILTEINSWSYVHTKYYFEKGERNNLLVKEISSLKNKLLAVEKPNLESMIDKTIKNLS